MAGEGALGIGETLFLGRGRVGDRAMIATARAAGWDSNEHAPECFFSPSGYSPGSLLTLTELEAQGHLLGRQYTVLIVPQG